MNFLESLVDQAKKKKQQIERGAQAVVAQVNPADNGRTYQTVMSKGADYTPPAQQNQSAFHQLTHNGATNFVGNGVAKPALRLGFAVNQGIGNLERKAAGMPTLDASHYYLNSPLTNKLRKASGYTGTKRQIAGDLLTTATNVAAPGGSKLLEGSAAKVLPKVIPKIVPKVVSTATVGAPVGAVSNVGAYVSGNEPLTKKGVIKSAEQGAIAGFTTGAALPVAGALIGKSVKLAAPAVERTANATKVANVSLGESGKVKNPLASGNRPYADVQKAIEDAHNSGDQATVVKLINEQVPAADQPAMRSALGITSDSSFGDVSPSRQPNGELVVESGSKMPQSQRLAAKSQPTAREVPRTYQPARLQESSSLHDNNSQFSPDQYIKDQSALQDQARNAGGPVGSQKLSAAKGELKAKFVDSFAPIEDKVNQAIKAGAKIAPENNIKYQIDRAIRGDTIGAQYIKDNGLASTIQNVPDTRAFDQYLIARHAQTLESNGIKTGRNTTADKQLVQALAPQYEQHAQDISRYSQQLLDKSVEYGLVSPELAQALKVKYPNYVPANRIFAEGEQQAFKGAGSGKASISTQTAVQKIKGSDRQIESPLGSLIKKTQDVVQQGERNKAASMLASYKDLPGNPFGLRELKPSETVGTKPTISFFDAGKQRRFETTPEVAAAAKSLNKEQLGLIGKVLSYPTRLLRLGATSLNPAFALANVTKDVASAFVNSRHPVQASIADPEVFLDALKATFSHGGAQYSEVVRQGAGGTSFDIARDAPVQNVRAIRAQKNAGTKALYTVTRPAQLFRAAENTIGRSEEFTRALQYFGNKKAALKSGSSQSEARVLGADAARNNTVNFARAGEYGRVLNSVLPYLNAGIQGSRTFLRNIKDRPVETGTKVVITGLFPAAAVTAWNVSSPKRKAAYDDISDYEKQGNLIIVPPNPKKDQKTGRWNVIKIPVSQELANLNNVVRNGVEALKNDASFNFGNMVADLTGSVTSLNVQSPRQLIGQATPQAVKPVLETVVNQNLFTGNQIVPDFLKNLAPRDQYNQYTSGTARALGALTNTSPLVTDNFIRTATGGLGQNAINLSDKALAATGFISPQDVKGKGFGASISDRFNGAQAKSASTYANGAVQAATDSLKQLPGYKSMSPQDKAKALNRLQNDIKTATYQAYDAKNGSGQFAPGFTGKKTKLSDRQAGLLDGNTDVASYLKTQSGKKEVSVPNDKPGSDFVNNINSMSKDDRDKWVTSGTLDSKYKTMYDRAAQIRVAGMPDLPQTNSTLKAYSDYLQTKAKNPSELKLNQAKKDFLKNAYQGALSDTSQELLGNYTVADKANAIASGAVDPKDLDAAIAYDDLMIKSGLSATPRISNTIRRKFNYSDAPKAGGSSGGSGSGKSKGGAKKKGRTLKASDFKLPTDITTKYATAGARLAMNAKL